MSICGGLPDIKKVWHGYSKALWSINVINQFKPNIMEAINKNEATKALGAEATVKSNEQPNIYPLAVLIFSMIGVSTVLQLVFLA